MLRKRVPLLFVIVAGFAGACASGPPTDRNALESSSSESTPSSSLIPVKAGHLVALDMAPLFVGVESDCFEKAGLAVETVFFTNPGDNNAALAGGQIDFSTNPFTLPFFAANSGVPIKTVAAAGGWGVMQVIIDSNYGVESLADLATYVTENPNETLKVATLRGDTLELILADGFEKAGIDSSDFDMVYFDDLLAMVDAFRLGEVDILSHIKPYTTQFVAMGSANVITDNAEVWSITTPNTVVSVLETTLDQRPEVVEAYIQGLQCAAEIINTDPETAIELLANGNYYRVDNDVLLTAFQTQPSPITFTPDLDAVQTVVDKMVQLNYIQADVPAQEIFDVSIVKELEK
ncbi:ABC transporter substrate-binding protein [Nodosilinea sp. P-1105]|uniref:ABC transporter substrate-binding protein n=1 Tax=Nodosilinea sp. P-1105 TaxID=2546229 RepID=UPI00146CA056|nr:ABC transporter substrate-binding protein [Nodosilinea sp. P-1105]NMF85043.1 ABC transporter substrate-binding protein [Nodosilinea sp. P-1105]